VTPTPAHRPRQPRRSRAAWQAPRQTRRRASLLLALWRLRAAVRGRRLRARARPAQPFAGWQAGPEQGDEMLFWMH